MFIIRPCHLILVGNDGLLKCYTAGSAQRLTRRPDHLGAGISSLTLWFPSNDHAHTIKEVLCEVIWSRF